MLTMMVEMLSLVFLSLKKVVQRSRDYILHSINPILRSQAMVAQLRKIIFRLQVMFH